MDKNTRWLAASPRLQTANAKGINKQAGLF
jgi:hypothetical protein